LASSRKESGLAQKKSQKRRKKSGESEGAEHSRVSSETLPRRSLEDAVEVAKALWSVYANNTVSFEELAEASGLSAKNPNFKYTVWAAQSYGIINAEREEGGRKNRYSLAETGRKIVAENVPGEAQEAKVKAVLTPTVMSKFFTDYNGAAIPPTPEHFANVLLNKLKIPRERTNEAMETIIANGKYAGILEDQGDGQPPMVKLSGVPTGEQTTAGADVKAAQESGKVATGWEKICFYITPIGDDNSEERRHANMMLKHVVKPVFDEQGFKVVRADEIAKTGIITQQVFEHLAKARICVADLSFHNPNAFYELGVRHAFLLPTIQLIHKSRKIPFDVSQGRTITIDTSDNYMVADHLESARKTLAEYLKNLLSGTSSSEDNPVQVYLPGVKMNLPK
jgi:hypothetical protein